MGKSIFVPFKSVFLAVHKTLQKSLVVRSRIISFKPLWWNSLLCEQSSCLLTHVILGNGLSTGHSDKDSNGATPDRRLRSQNNLPWIIYHKQSTGNCMLRVQLVQQTVMACFFPSAVIPSRLLLPTARTELASNAAVLNVALVLKGVKTQNPGTIERKKWVHHDDHICSLLSRPRSWGWEANILVANLLQVSILCIFWDFCHLANLSTHKIVGRGKNDWLLVK